MIDRLWVFNQRAAVNLLDYYTTIEIIISLFIAGLLALVYKNSHYSKQQKRSCYWSLGLLLIINLIEWTSVMLDGVSGQYRIWLVINKFLNYSLIPFLGYFVIHIWVRHSKYDRLLAVLLPGNVLFQLASIFTGWTFWIDQNSHYHQGRYYIVYLFICIIVMFTIVSAYHQFEQKTFSGDRLFMFYTFFVVFLGIVIQEVSGGRLRTTSLTITIGMCFLLNRFNNFTQKVSDMKISRDNVMMRTDIMTGMQNRYAYEEKLGEMVTPQGGKEFLAFSIDINGLKEMNDNRGHLAGDGLIREVAAIIRDTLGEDGECYRIGGDEFAAIVPGDSQQGEKYKRQLELEAVKYRINTGQNISFSIGYADSESHPQANLERLMQLADQQMYQAKRQYYSHPNNDRRGRSSR